MSETSTTHARTASASAVADANSGTASDTVDVINLLAGIIPGDRLDRLRDHRPQAKENAQRSFTALLEPEDPAALPHRDRYAVAAFTAGLLGSSPAEDFYRDLLRDEDEAASWTVAELLDSALGALPAREEPRGPYGVFESPALAAESVPGPQVRIGSAERDVLGDRLAAGLEFTQLLVLHPRDARPVHLARLLAAGWDETGIVTLAQLVSFLTFQIRLAAGLAVLGQVPAAGAASGGDSAVEDPVGADPVPGALTATPRPSQESSAEAQLLERLGDRVHPRPELRRPRLFRSGGLGWVPWIAPVAEDDLTPVQREALVEAGRAANPYFRLLARDPAALRARTLTDFDIFFTTSDGLGRAERELAATAASRLNGCLFCASVHARWASEESGRADLVQRLLDEGVGVRLGEERWDAVIEASLALTRTPQGFGPAQVSRLRAAGLGDGDIVDVLNCAAFFNWANRLMLSLGEPEELTVEG